MYLVGHDIGPLTLLEGVAAEHSLANLARFGTTHFIIHKHSQYYCYFPVKPPSEKMVWENTILVGTLSSHLRWGGIGIYCLYNKSIWDLQIQYIPRLQEPPVSYCSCRISSQYRYHCEPEGGLWSKGCFLTKTQPTMSKEKQIFSQDSFTKSEYDCSKSTPTDYCGHNLDSKK